jgi:hypothetical protein
MALLVPAAVCLLRGLLSKKGLGKIEADDIGRRHPRLELAVELELFLDELEVPERDLAFFSIPPLWRRARRGEG